MEPFDQTSRGRRRGCSSHRPKTVKTVKGTQGNFLLLTCNDENLTVQTRTKFETICYCTALHTRAQEKGGETEVFSWSSSSSSSSSSSMPLIIWPACARHSRHIWNDEPLFLPRKIKRYEKLLSHAKTKEEEEENSHAIHAGTDCALVCSPFFPHTITISVSRETISQFPFFRLQIFVFIFFEAAQKDLKKKTKNKTATTTTKYPNKKCLLLLDF